MPAVATKTKPMSVKDELIGLQRREGGLLKPKSVVEYARNPATALHSQFTWDDGEAAAKYRLIEAGRLIRTFITVLPEAPDRKVRQWVSLSTERTTGRGYRHVGEVMSRAEWRAQFLADALAELEVFRTKYAALTELCRVFDAIDAVSARKKKR